MRQNDKTKLIALSGLVCALTLIMTFFGFTVPATRCWVHFGAAMVIVAPHLLPKKYAALSVALGMGLCDLLTGYTAWAPFTFAIRYAQTYVLASFINKDKTALITGYVITGIIDIGGYYLAEVILTANLIAPLSSAVSELVLNIFGIVVGNIIWHTLDKIVLRNN